MSYEDYKASLTYDIPPEADWYCRQMHRAHQEAVAELRKSYALALAQLGD